MKYNIIYADPPWSFKTYSQKGKGRSPKYPVMTKSDIQALDVPSICADDCILFLWVTWPCLEEGLDLIKAWGFTYKTDGFLWVKKNKKSETPFWGLGYWTRANSEPCLLATKGNPKRIARDVHQIVHTSIQEHSRKPDEVRSRIVQLMGDVPRIELFARQKVEGWASWGNEVVSDVKLKKRGTDHGLQSKK